jgi:hypothetical protein
VGLHLLYLAVLFLSIGGSESLKMFGIPLHQYNREAKTQTMVLSLSFFWVRCTKTYDKGVWMICVWVEIDTTKTIFFWGGETDVFGGGEPRWLRRYLCQGPKMAAWDLSG